MRRPRPRRLSQEDRELWRRVAETLEPLDPETRGTAPPKDRGEAPAPEVAPASGPTPAPTHSASDQPRERDPGFVARPAPPSPAPRVTFDLAPDPMAALQRSPPRMDARAYARLRRGRVEPEQVLDLHGHSAERAHRILERFLLTAVDRDVRLVLVITGKGLGGRGPSRGVLRAQLPRWLGQPPLSGIVLQLAPAHARHGGEGAYYVYLRRRR